ncbi:MAG: ABC transporter ATP-binding protein [Patescibacteria group bacterium]
MLAKISAKISGKIPEELKVIWRHIENKRLFYLGAAASLIFAAVSAVIPYIYGRLTDAAVSGAFQSKIILFFLLFWFFLSLFRDFLSRFAEKIGTNAGFDAANNFEISAVSHYIDLPLVFHKEKKSGTILSRIERGWGAILGFLDSTAFTTLPRFLSLIFAFFIVFFIEWRLSLIIAAMVAFYALATFKYTLFMIKVDKKVHRFWDKAYGDVYDAIGNIFSVKSFTNEKFEKNKIRADFHRSGRANKESMKYWTRRSAWQETIINLSFIIVFSAGLLLLSVKELSVGKFVMFIGYFNLISAPVIGLGFQYSSLRRNFLALNRALKLFKNKPEADYPFAKDIGKIRGEVVFQNVFFKYKKGGEVLKNINFSAKAGEMVALVGESGVGKSTLVNLISRYYLPVKGKIFVDAKEIRSVKINSLRKQIAFVPQEVALFNDTVKNNIAYGKIGAKDEEIIAAAKAASADEFIEKFAKKYKTLVGERGVKLSTGQKQRIAIARAILRAPRILILDEATAALDSVSERLVQEALEKLIKGRTTFVIAHRLSTIMKADKIIVLEKGEIVEMGRHEDLIKQEGIYKNFWELQTRVEAVKPARLLNGMIEDRAGD